MYPPVGGFQVSFKTKYKQGWSEQEKKLKRNTIETLGAQVNTDQVSMPSLDETCTSHMPSSEDLSLMQS